MNEPRVVLIVGRQCASCDEAERLWRAVTDGLGIELVVHRLDVGPGGEPPDGAPGHDEPGREGERVRALPALLVNDRPLVVGVPSEDDARALLEDSLGAN